MTQFQLRQQQSNGITSRRSTVCQVVLRENRNDDDDEGEITHRHVSRISQLYLPNGSDYQAQEHVPPTGIENQQQFLLTRIEERDHSSVIVSRTTSDELFNKQILNKKLLYSLYFLEPILSGVFLFPILILFWQCGWNFVISILDRFSHVNPDDEQIVYPFRNLIIPYVIVEILILILYLCQNQIYKYLKKRNQIVEIILLKLHIFYLSVLYVIQWVVIWTLYHQYLPNQLDFQILLTISSIAMLIVLIGHLSDLVCSPFIFSYDSIEYCIHFGCPLLTKDMPSWKINLINFLLYEVIISNLSILIWHGLYNILDDYLYPDNVNKSAGICLIAGYALYFPLMYFQSYFEELNLKFSFWTFISINFPQFYRNIRHLLSFVSCVFTWRGWWMLFDEHLLMFDDSSRTYLLFVLMSFIVLSIIQSASSLNGPLSNIPDPYGFFPLYPHSYISIVQTKFSKFFCSKKKKTDEETGRS